MGRRGLPLVAAISLVLAGCGDGARPTTPEPAATTAPASGAAAPARPSGPPAANLPFGSRPGPSGALGSAPPAASLSTSASQRPSAPAAAAPAPTVAPASACVLPSNVSWKATEGEYAGPIFDSHLHLFVDRRLRPTNAGSEGLCQFLDKNGFIAALGFYALPAVSPPKSNLIVSQSALLIENARTRVLPMLEMGLDTQDLFSPTSTFAQGQFSDTVLQGYLAPSWIFQGIGEVPGNVWAAPGIDSQPMQVVLRNVNAKQGIVMIHVYEGPDVNTQRAKIDADVKSAPNVTFLFHGSKNGFDLIEPLITKYPNVYFSWDGGPGWMVGSWGSLMHPGATPSNPLGTGGSTDQFFSDLQRVGVDTVVNENLSWLTTRLQKYPDRITSAMDLNAPWHFDDGSSAQIVKIYRKIVAKLPADLQERFAYKTAMRVFGPRLGQ